MAHFAELDDNNVVIRVHVVNDADTADENGNEVEQIGRDFCARSWGGRWVQTSYHGRIRYRYAGPGYIYDEQRDAFIMPCPSKEWHLDNETLEWVPPVPIVDQSTIV